MGKSWKTRKSIRRYCLVLMMCVSTLAYLQLSYMESWSRSARHNQILLNRSRYMSSKYGSRQISATVVNKSGNDLEYQSASSKLDNASHTYLSNSDLHGETLPLKYRMNTDTNYTATPLMFLFSSWKYSKEKAPVHAAIIRLWSAWSFIRTAVFTKDSSVAEYATSAGWLTLSHMTVNADCLGPPVLPPMFSVVKRQYDAHFYGYSNADIVFGDGLSKTLQFLHEYDAWRNKPLLIVGRRYNVDFSNDPSIVLNTPSDVSELMKKGNLVLRSTDYFFTNKLFPWFDVPKVTIGRPYVVRAIIGYALKKKFAVIEATKTIEAVHLTTKDGNYASWHVKGMGCNQKVLGRIHWRIPIGRGHCECAMLETFMQNNTIHVRHRKPNKTICA